MLSPKNVLVTRIFNEGNTHPISNVLALLDTSELDMGALELSCRIKLAESYLERVRTRLRAHANAEFQRLQADNPNDNQFTIEDVAVVNAYSPRCTWAYPEELTQKMNEATAALKDAQKNKQATRIVPVVDPTTSVVFSINLLQPKAGK